MNLTKIICATTLNLLHHYKYIVAIKSLMTQFSNISVYIKFFLLLLIIETIKTYFSLNYSLLKWQTFVFSNFLNITLITYLALNVRRSINQNLNQQIRLQNLLDSVQVAAAAINEKGDIQLCNEAISQIFKHNKEKILGTNIKSLISSEYHEIFDDVITSLITTEQTTNFNQTKELIGIRKGYEEFPLLIKLYKVIVNKMCLFTVIFEDISKTKSSEIAEKIALNQLKQQLILFEEQKNRLESIVNTVGTAIITITDKGTIESFNEAAQKIFGYLDREVIGKNIKILMPEKHKQQHDNYLKKYSINGNANIIGKGQELFGIRKTGESFPLHLHVGQVNLQNGVIFTGAIEDLTNLKQAQQNQQDIYRALEIEKTRLEEQSWVKSTFLKIIVNLQTKTSKESFSEELLNNLIPFIDAQLGIFYFAEKNDKNSIVLNRYASYGNQFDNSIPTSFQLGQGMVGQAAKTLQSFHLTRLPHDYIHRINSALGDSVPKQLIILPIALDNKILAVIEIASMNTFTSLHQNLMHEVVNNCAIIINSINSVLRIEELLEKTQHQADELLKNEKVLKIKNQQLELQKLESENQNHQLKKIQSEFKIISDYKSDFLAQMNKELLTPIYKIVNLTKKIQSNENQNLNKDQIEDITTIYYSVIELKKMIVNIMNISQVKENQPSTNPSSTNIKKLIDNLKISIKPTNNSKANELITKINSTVPQEIITDEKRLKQILSNLIQNIIKYLDTDSVTLEVIIDEKQPLSNLNNIISFIVYNSEFNSNYLNSHFLSNGNHKNKNGMHELDNFAISNQLANLLGGNISIEYQSVNHMMMTLRIPQFYNQKIN